METQEAKEISDSMSRIQAKGKDEKRESTSGPYDSLYLMDNDAIPDTPRRQTENVSTNGSEIGSSSPWAPLPRAILTPRQYAPSLIMPRSRWASTQKKFARNVSSFRQLAVHSIVNPPEKDEVLKSKLHHSSSGEDSIEPTRRGVPGPPKFEEASQFLEATSTNTQENANEGSRKPMSPRHSLGHNPTPSPRGYYRTDYPPSPYVRSRRGSTPLFRRKTIKRTQRYPTTEWPKGPPQCKLWSEKYVPKETEDVQFQYQDPPQTLSKPQDNGANPRGRIFAQRRKKRSPGKKTQHSPLDSSLDLSASAEKLSREDESPSRTEPQLMGRHKLSDWKLHNGKSKDWRRKPSAKALTARQFLTAIYSHKQFHYSTVHAEGPGMAEFGPDIPVAAQRSRRGKTSMVVRNEFPAFLPWLDRKGFRDMGMKRDHKRDIFDVEKFEVEAHRKLGL